MQVDIQQYYQAQHPGEVQVIGVDTWNGTTSQLRGFKNTTGATYPLLLNGALAAGGNVTILYGDYDDYIVINKQGIVRYVAQDIWGHGNRYHLDELRAAIDSLVTPTVDVPRGGTAGAFALDARPNPFAGATRIAFAHGRDGALPVRVTVHDLAGRRVATLYDATAVAGTRQVTWDGRDAHGARVRPGVYLVRATWPGATLTRRIVSLR